MALRFVGDGNGRQTITLLLLRFTIHVDAEVALRVVPEWRVSFHMFFAHFSRVQETRSTDQLARP